MNTIGNKIRVFRKLNGMSQLDLELAINTSTGTISRIENNETNPSKETILRISKVLKINSLGLDYLIGHISEPASIEEITQARSDVSSFFEKKGVLAYMVDDRSRLIDISSSFCKLGKLPEKDKFLLKPLVEVIFDSKYGIRKNLDEELFHRTTFLALLRNYQEMYFMQGDPVYEDMMQFIDLHSEAKKIWAEVKDYCYDYSVRNDATREVYFVVNGVKVKMNYSVEPLWSNPRFRLLEYSPNNYLAKLLLKLT